MDGFESNGEQKKMKRREKKRIQIITPTNRISS